MKFNRLKLLIFIFVVGSLSGCFPYKFTEAPGAKGQVIDKETRAPIEGALVTLSSSSPANRNNLLTTPSLENGSFKIQSNQAWGLYIVPMDPAAINGEIKVEKPGYKTKIQNLHTQTMGKGVFELGVIELEREQ